jgi:hypothetical protein
MDWGIVILILVGLVLGPILGGAFHSAFRTRDFAQLGDIKG